MLSLVTLQVTASWKKWSIMIDRHIHDGIFVIHSRGAPGCSVTYPMLRQDQLKQEHLNHLPDTHDMPIGVQHPYCRIQVVCLCLSTFVSVHSVCRSVWFLLQSIFQPSCFCQIAIASFFDDWTFNMTICQSEKHQKQGFADNVEVISKASDGSPGHVVREVFWFRRWWQSCSMFGSWILLQGGDASLCSSDVYILKIRERSDCDLSCNGGSKGMICTGSGDVLLLTVEMIGLTPNVKRTRSGQRYSDGNNHECDLCWSVTFDEFAILWLVVKEQLISQV